MTLTINFIQGIKGVPATDVDGVNQFEFLMKHYLKKCKEVIFDECGDTILPISMATYGLASNSSKKVRDLFFRDDGVLNLNKKRTREVLGL